MIRTALTCLRLGGAARHMARVPLRRMTAATDAAPTLLPLRDMDALFASFRCKPTCSDASSCAKGDADCTVKGAHAISNVLRELRIEVRGCQGRSLTGLGLCCVPLGVIHFASDIRRDRTLAASNECVSLVTSHADPPQRWLHCGRARR